MPVREAPAAGGLAASAAAADWVAVALEVGSVVVGLVEAMEVAMAAGAKVVDLAVVAKVAEGWVGAEMAVAGLVGAGWAGADSAAAGMVEVTVAAMAAADSEAGWEAGLGAGDLVVGWGSVQSSQSCNRLPSSQRSQHSNPQLVEIRSPHTCK